MNTLEKVIAVVGRETGADIEASTRLDSLNIDSLEFVCLMQTIQGEVADVPDSEWAAIETVNDIAEACDRSTIQ
jgi:acyl carrier protein